MRPAPAPRHALVLTRLRGMFAVTAALALVLVGAPIAIAPAAADPAPVSYPWTDTPYWEVTFQAGLPTTQQWLATTAGGGAPIDFTATPAGTTTADISTLGLSVGWLNSDKDTVIISGIVGASVPAGVYQYTITATAADHSTASQVLTITVLAAIVVTGPPTFPGQTDWWVSTTGQHQFSVPIDDATYAEIHFPDTAFDSIWPFCTDFESDYGGGYQGMTVNCAFSTLPADGAYRFTVHATNDLGAADYTGTVHIGTSFTAPTITGASEVKVGAGSAFPGFTPTLTGSPSPTITAALSGGNTLTLATLGLSLDAATGVISGTVPGNIPSGSYQFTLTATGYGTATHDVTITVGRPPVVTNPGPVSGLPSANLGDLQWTWNDDGDTTVSDSSAGWSSAGLTYTSETGGAGVEKYWGVEISPTASTGSTTITIATVTNDFGSTDLTLNVTVGELPVIGAGTPTTITAQLGTAISPFSPTLSGGAVTSYGLTQTGGLALGGGLPTGLAFDAATASITGTATDPSQVGSYEYDLVAHGEFGDSTPYSVTITITPAAFVGLDVQRATTGKVMQGGSASVDVSVVDGLGTETPVLASDLVVTSDVSSDVITVVDGGFSVAFPHASPHTFTVTQTSTGLTTTFLIQVTPASGSLASTGTDVSEPIGIVLALLLAGIIVLMLVLFRRRA